MRCDVSRLRVLRERAKEAAQAHGAHMFWTPNRGRGVRAGGGLDVWMGSAQPKRKSNPSRLHHMARKSDGPSLTQAVIYVSKPGR
jgi:hypothetical protein